MKYRFMIIGLMACLCSAGTVQAQTPPQALPPAQAPQPLPPAVPAPGMAAAPSAVAVQTPPVDPKALAAAQELVKSFDMNTLMRGLFDVLGKTILPILTRDNPNQSQEISSIAVDAVQKAFAAHADELTNNKAIAYAQVFTADEIMQLKAFYQTPVGQKMLKAMPELMQKSAVLDQKIFIAIMSEVHANMIMEMHKKGLQVPQEMETR